MPDAYTDALQVALRYVSFKPRTVAEVRRRVGRDFEQPVVEQVLDSLKRYGYLDDAEYAAQWRQSRDRRKPRGSSLIRREMRAKGIAEPIIDDALAGLDEVDAAYRAGGAACPAVARSRRNALRGLPPQDVGLPAAAWLPVWLNPRHRAPALGRKLCRCVTGHGLCCLPGERMSLP